MQTLEINTSHNVAIEYELASIGDRLLASFIDLLVMYAYATVVGSALGTAQVESATVWILAYLPFLLYNLIFEALLNGQSLGKMAMNTKVIRLDGNTPSLASYVMRWLFGLIEVTSGFGGMFALMTVIVRGKGQRLGDVAAGTCVVKIKTNIRLQPYMLPKQMMGYQPQFPNVTALSDRDVAILKEVLLTYRTNRNIAPVELAAERVKKLLNTSAPGLGDLKFLETVVRDYNFITSEMLAQAMSTAAPA
ncbi:MAG: RDD family protein [Bernardetiaceae bacterium]|jgi:uncharacterized RDD family membrane protein YckC|nr:RDD family protein [Bernardetiaceae bacterium]